MCYPLLDASPFDKFLFVLLLFFGTANGIHVESEKKRYRHEQREKISFLSNFFYFHMLCDSTAQAQLTIQLTILY